MAFELSDRQRAVLGLVVKQYIETAQPVGSKAVVKQYGLGVSPATIRNEMAVLEEHGLLTHPHTSAGRVPTEEGYRFFVEHLMGEARLPEEEQLLIRHQFHQSGLDLGQWAKLAATVLSRAARGAAMVTTPRTRECRYKRLELIAIRDSMVLLVLVLQEGFVSQRMISLAEPEDEESLKRVSNKLNSLLDGFSANQMAGKLLQPEPLEEEIGHLVAEMMEEHDHEASVEVYRSGLSHLLEAPEFAETKAGRQMVRVMEEHRLLSMLSRELAGAGGVHVIIGGEGRWHDLSDCSVILSSYGWTNRISGVMGVLGPMRMPYSRAISSVQYVSDLLSELVRTLYAGGGGVVEIREVEDRPL